MPGGPTQPDANSGEGSLICSSGLVVEYIVAIDVTWVRFPAAAFFIHDGAKTARIPKNRRKACAMHHRHLAPSSHRLQVLEKLKKLIPRALGLTVAQELAHIFRTQLAGFL